MACLRFRDNTSKIFLLSGLGDSVRRDLARKIHLLGGKYFDIQDFKAICTHVVCGRLSRSEKFLGACATGKWVLHPDYVQDSFIAGSWLDEEQYEWCDGHITNKYEVDMTLAMASRRWRFMLGGTSAAFTGWKVAVIAGAKRSKVIKGLLVSGGAEVLQLRIPVRNPARVANTLGYIFVSEHNSKSVIHLIDYGVLCIKPEFIGDFLIKDPQPDPMDYLVQVNSMEELATEVPDPLSQDSFLMDSQRSMYLSPHKTNSPVTPVSTSTISIGTPSNSHEIVEEWAITPTCSTQTAVFKRLKTASKPVSKLVDDITDLTVKGEHSRSINESNNVIQSTSYASQSSDVNHDSEEVIEVIDLTDSLEESDVIINTEFTEKDHGRKSGLNDDKKQITRKSKRHVSYKSPAWKSLIPGNKIKKEIIESGEGEGNMTKASTCVANSSTVKRNLLDSMTEQSNKTSTPAKTSKILAKTPVTKKQLLENRLNLSPITKFFEPTKNIKENCMNASDIAVSSKQASTGIGLSWKLNKSEILSQPTSDKSSCNKVIESKMVSESEKNMDCSVNGSVQVESVEHSVNTGSKHLNQSGKRLNSKEIKGKELKENSKKVDLTGNKECKNKIVKSSQRKQSPRKHKPDSKGDRKRKSTDIETEGAQSNGPSEKKRVTRSSPAKNKDFLLVGSPDQSHCIHGLTTILLTPSKMKTDVTGQLSGSRDTIATELSTSNSQRISGRNQDQGNDGQVVNTENGKKRKADDTELEYVLTHLKRKRIGLCEWSPSSLIVNLRENEDVPESVKMPETTKELFFGTLEDGFIFEALEYIGSQITFKNYPDSDIINELMRNILLKTEEEVLCNKSSNILSHMLMLHPPITASLQEVYLRALAGCKIDEDCQVGAEWNFIHQCICDSFSSDDAQIKRNSRLLFKFILELLQYNIQHFQSTDGFHDNHYRKHMLLRIIWTPSYHIVFNKRCRTLVDLMSEVIQSFQAIQCQTEKKSLLEMLDGILWMVAMVTECCRLDECGNVDPIQALHADKTSVFVHEISRKLTAANISDSFLLDTVIDGLQLPWLRVGVCQQLLNTYDDYLLMDKNHNETKSLTFLLIVTNYLFLLPVFDMTRTPSSRSPAVQRLKEVNINHSPATLRNCLRENTDMNKHNVDRITLKAMKKNHKGETPLHVACIKNDIATVKSLLKVPGINVNAPDNVGWTPLHEASNHGNTECVLELLKFIPSKTVDTFFTKGNTECRKVDLLAVNGEGITPLHDAVLNNQPEVCRILLQHGGPKLLEARTCHGYTPIDLAESDEMISLLSSYSAVQRKQSDSISVFGSQESSSSVEDCMSSIPNDDLYQEVIYSDGDRVYANIKSTTRYIHIVTLLIKHYISLRKLHTICQYLKDRHLLQSIREQNNYCDTVNRNKNDRISADDIPSCQNSKKLTGLNVQTISTVYNSVGNSQLGLFRERNPTVNNSSETDIRVNTEELKNIRKDLKVLKKFPQYLNLFRNHLVKLCRSEDRRIVKDEVQQLSYVTEGPF